ncbi:hypothetical protein FGG08_005029 [Glutinoglossum americanum]|uniref:2EXR domain-containing protein n=1 Tax=Glutinoglossum americanum TaxID=1670608 RepID=A0A9P8KWF6_9PEZI|nr:hypothetical protein FGG08_005029 [Glutinoglossum americanum]
MTTPAPSSSSFPFLRLPPEIRNKIYRYLLTTTSTIASPHRPPQHAIRNGLTPALLAANRQIHSEAQRILYRENRAEIYVSDAARVPGGGARSADLMRAYSVLVEASPAAGAVATREAVEGAVGWLAARPAVGELRVEIPWKPVPARVHMVKVRRLMEPFKRLRGVGRVEFVGCMKPEAAAVYKEIMESKVGGRFYVSPVKTASVV